MFFKVERHTSTQIYFLGMPLPKSMLERRKWERKKGEEKKKEEGKGKK